MSSYNNQVAAQIPAEVHMISGCDDNQTSADVSNIQSFQLPDPQGKAGGACTAALLAVLYDENSPQDAGSSWVDVLRQMRRNLGDKGYDQYPQLSSSRMIDVDAPMQILNDPSGVKRAVLIGINYVGQNGELSGCHNDVRNITQYLQGLGFQPSNTQILMDDQRHLEPTYNNIMEAFHWIVNESQPGDTVWIHYSGHGGHVEDQDGDEEDGRDETLIPVDFQSAGQIRDDDLLEHLVKPMKAGVLVTCLMDCCHSGTVLDLPYNFTADGKHSSMEQNDGFDLGHVGSILGFGAELAAGAAMAAGLATMASGGGGGGDGDGDVVGDLVDECCVIL